MEDRRSEPRVPLDCPVFATLRLGDDEMFCLLRDVSLSGFQVAMPPGEDASTIVIGKQVQVIEPPDSLAQFLDHSSGTVVWVSEDTFGVRFDEQLTIEQEALEKYLEEACF